MATRLLPVTEKIPKSMIEVAGEPFIGHQLRLLKKNGVRDVVVCAGHLSTAIGQYVGMGREFGLRVSYSIDGLRPLGTAGAIRKALHLLGYEFFTLYGDSYLTHDMQKILDSFHDQDRIGMMTVYKNQDRHGQSNVEMCDGTIVAYSKKAKTPRMQHIDYGLGVFNYKAFASLKADQPADLSELYQDLLGVNELATYEVDERFYEIGSFDGLKETEEKIRALSKIPELRDHQSMPAGETSSGVPSQQSKAV